MATLAELRARTGPVPLPKATRTVTLVEGQHLLDESQRLEEERVDLLIQVERDAEKAADDGRDRTQKAGQKPEPTQPPRLDEIRAEQRALAERIAEFQGVLGLTGISGGEWQRFKDENPAREDNDADQRLAGGTCNTSVLFSALGRFVTSWNDEALGDGDWDAWLAERICYADRRDLVTAVVELHESRLPRIPKVTSSQTEPAATD